MGNDTFLNFEDARNFIRNLDLKTYSVGWKKYCKSKEYNSKIPKAPDHAYKHSGWVSWADFLGSKNVATQDKVFREFNEAREFTKKLNIKTIKEWSAYCKSGSKPNDIPTCPNKTYQNSGWVSFGDWLGTNRISGKEKSKLCLPFKEAKIKVHSLNLKTVEQYRNYCRTEKPIDLPVSPDHTYKNNGWVSWADWLGHNTISNFDKSKFYSSYEEAKMFASKLNLTSSTDWEEYCNNNTLPANIPLSPRRVYKKEWTSWDEFLCDYYSFEEARKVIHSLNLTKRKWIEYKNSSKRDIKIPISPSKVYKKSGWVSWNDWLGGKEKYLGEWLPFDEAHEFVVNLKLESGTAWKTYIKSGNKPNNIPSNPEKVYKNYGWKSMGDWLGNSIIATRLLEYLPFDEARKFVWSLKLKSGDDYYNWWCENKLSKLPANPNSTYKEKGWISWADWVGTKIGFNGEFLDFNDAKKIVHALAFKSQSEWNKYCASGNKQIDIPASPEYFYKDSGWTSWGDWLGTGRIADQLKKEQLFISFKEAKIFVKTLNLKSHKDWVNYCNSNQKPENIPTDPQKVYDNKQGEWKGWADFLGYIGTGNHVWNKYALIAYLEEAKSYINVCSIPVLLTIIESNGLFNFINKQQLKRLQDSEPGSQEREQVTSAIIEEITQQTEEKIDNATTDVEEEINNEEVKELVNEEEPEKECDNTVVRIKQLQGLDNDIITASLDDERIQFLINDSINNLWYDTLAGKLNISKITGLVLEKSLPNLIKDKFLSEHQEVTKMKLPVGWEYQYEPLLMQKLFAYKLSVNKRYGNWSDAGAGKTISAILAGRYVGAKNVLIITFNSTIGSEDTRGWAKEIKDSFPDSNIYTKLDKHVKFNNNKHNYLILNYETFQQKGAANYAISLLEKNRFDYIILDEVHSIKQRGDVDESKRREVIIGLIGEVKKLNPDYYLSAMSATPVINDLTEAKSLLELITFRKLDDVNTRDTISNCIELFRRLVTHGIRYKNIEDNILKDNHHTIVDIDGSDLFAQSNLISDDDVTAKELLILDKKLEAIAPYINSSNGKSVIYTHYVTGMEERIYSFLTNLGFKVGVYTGGSTKLSRESAISDFIGGKYDILLGSRPIGTGVDGLQKISDREIILSLPWTNAELHQLEKRVNRKGSKFKNTGMDVIIPIVNISNDKKTQHLNTDRNRYNTIMYKATVANAAVDGIIPEVLMPKREKLESNATDNMDEWIKRLKENEFLTVEREELETRLFPDITDEEIRKQKIKSELQEFYGHVKRTRSDNLHKEFTDNPDAWFRYHALRDESIKDWEEIPYEYIAKKIEEPTDIIVDFGCGKNQFKTCIPNNKVWSFDYQSFDDSVIKCDMKDVSQWLANESVDVAVFSLALWGTNYPDYITEAFRVLKRKGVIYIAEPLSKYETPEKEEELRDLIGKAGFKVVGGLEKKANSSI